ncbi:MAG TPA: MotA/TolQ/ExbB proton channel family protein [Planctomycetota bacterium]|jgi:biopolymer transport protein ExbB
MLRKLVPYFSVAAVMACVAGTAYAMQEGGGDQAVVRHTWFDLFRSTGLVGILLVITSMIGTALLIQFLVTMSESKLENHAVLAEVENLLSQGQVDEAYQIATEDKSYSSRLIAGALARSFGGFEETKKGMEETAIVEGFRLNSKVSYLSLVGNIGPLLGLLGTVTGMIASFQVIEGKKSPTPGDMAKGVYESLVNTTIGLFIAIVFLTAYFFMKNKVSDVTLRVNSAVGEMLARTMSPEAQQGASK